jgi:hypothetical protein
MGWVRTALHNRWVRVGLLALGILLVNVVSRFITWKFKIVDESQLAKLDAVLIGLLAILVMAATAWWSVRYPFPRVFGDIGLAVVAGVILCLTVAPFAGGQHPFSDSLGALVAEFVVFSGVIAVFGFLAFFGVVTLGKDWKSRGLRKYQQNYVKRPHRTVRG